MQKSEDMGFLQQERSDNMNLTLKEKRALDAVIEENKHGCGIWTRALEDFEITRYTMNKLEKKGLVHREISGDSGHSLYWVTEKAQPKQTKLPNYWLQKGDTI